MRKMVLALAFGAPMILCLWLVGSMGAKGNGVATTQSDKAKAKQPGMLHPMLVRTFDLERQWGYVDDAGRTVIPPQFYKADYFKEGRARVVVLVPDDRAEKKESPFIDDKGGKIEAYGFIDRSGKFIVRPEYDYAGEFSDGMAEVKTRDQKYGFVNRDGKLVIPPRFGGVGDFNQGLAPVDVTLRKNPFKGKGKWGYINKSGKFVIKPQYVLAGVFSHGLASVCIDDNIDRSHIPPCDRYKATYIDRTGKVVIKTEYSGGSRFHDGLAIVRSGEKYGYIDTSGKLVIPFKYHSVKPFSEGLALVGLRLNPASWQSRQRYGFINKKGKEVIPLKFKDARSFSDGLAAVSEKRFSVRYIHGYINKKGQYVIKPHFDSIGKPFRNGLAPDYRGLEKAGSSVPCMINKKGEVVVWGYVEIPRVPVPPENSVGP
ncbi:MAG: WG repeat-containing protein [Phycisphaerae bacterium]|nr:WG repeat-containing protein [Phycisphaerae bacterium]